jgi:hypothetical protein
MLILEFEQAVLYDQSGEYGLKHISGNLKYPARQKNG